MPASDRPADRVEFRRPPRRAQLRARRDRPRPPRGASVSGHPGARRRPRSRSGDDLTFHESFGDVKTNANSLGVIANTGYRMDRGRYFFEPIASLTYVDTRLDNLS